VLAGANQVITNFRQFRAKQYIHLPTSTITPLHRPRSHYETEGYVPNSSTKRADTSILPITENLLKKYHSYYQLIPRKHADSHEENTQDREYFHSQYKVQDNSEFDSTPE